MTPEELDPARSDEAVRRLLAAAAEPLTMPPEVAARLDDVLAGLDADRATSKSAADAAPVIDIAPIIDMAKRRTSRWPKVLVAAAVVSVVGLGLGNVLNQSGSTMSADSAGSADSGARGAAETAPSPEGSQGPEKATDEQGEQVDGFSSFAGGRPPRLRSSSVTVDAQRIADRSLPTAPADLVTRASKDCRLPATSKGDVRIAVRLDREPATLVFRAKEDGRRLAEVFSCGDAESPVLTTTVDAP